MTLFDDTLFWDRRCRHVIEETSIFLRGELREERLERLLAWSPAQDLVGILDRLYFSCGRDTHTSSRDQSSARLLLATVVRQLCRRHRLDEDALRDAFLNLDDQAFVATFGDGDGLTAAKRPQARQYLARKLFDEDLCNA